MEYNDKNVTELYLEGLTSKQIGDKLGVSRSAITRKIRRLRKKDPTLFPYKVLPVAKAAKVVKQEINKPVHNRYAFNSSLRTNYRNPTKADLYEELRKAVENTK